MLSAGQVVPFNGFKFFKFIKNLGSGGDGETTLFEDETTNIKFAIKKYSPRDVNRRDEHYTRFVEEIKILFKLAHPNIVRVYNYYLYPESKTGYLQMEYVEGETIDNYDSGWLFGWDEIFINTIKAFGYLEENKILHRDIRPANIMIDKNGNVKIIDFGFGKIIESPIDERASMILNWPVSEFPEELRTSQTYNHQTEIYFLGKLFSQLPREDIFEPFKYQHIIDRMCKISPAQRYLSFAEIIGEISKDALEHINFSEEDKTIYINFADALYNQIAFFRGKCVLESSVTLIMGSLQNVVRANKLEKYIQNNRALLNCFVKCNYSFYDRKDIEVDTVNKFYLFLSKLNSEKQELVIDNIVNRLLTIDIQVEPEDVPF